MADQHFQMINLPIGYKYGLTRREKSNMRASEGVMKYVNGQLITEVPLQNVCISGQELDTLSERIQTLLFVYQLPIEHIDLHINEGKQDHGIIDGIPNYINGLFVSMYNNNDSIDIMKEKTGYSQNDIYNCLRMGFTNLYKNICQASQMIEAIKTRELMEKMNNNIEKMDNNIEKMNNNLEQLNYRITILEGYGHNLLER